MLKFTKYGRKSCTGSFTVNSSTATDANPTSNVKTTSSASDDHPISVGAIGGWGGPLKDDGTDGVDSSIRLSHYRSYSGKGDDGVGVGMPVKIKEPEVHYGGRGAEGMTWSGSKKASAPHHYSDYDSGMSSTSSSSSSDAGGSITPDQDHPPTRPEVHLRISKISPEELRRLDPDYEIKPDHQGKPPGVMGKSVSFTSSTLDLFKMKKRRSLKNATTVAVTSCMGDGVDKVRVPVFNDGYFPKIQPLSKLFARKRPTC